MSEGYITLPTFTRCTGSRQRAYAFASDRAQCPVCREWVRTAGPGSFETSTHIGATPRDIQDAASIIRWEYRQARLNGTLHSDPERWHTTALVIAQAGKHVR